MPSPGAAPGEDRHGRSSRARHGRGGPRSGRGRRRLGVAHRRGRLADLRREDVATLRYGLDAPLRLVSEATAQLHQALHERIVRDERVGPEGLDQLVLGDEAGVVEGEGLYGVENPWAELCFLA